MVTLETFLREEIAKQNNLLHQQKIVLQNSRLALDCTPSQNFTYEIQLQSLWSSEGEEDITTKHKGEIFEAIKIAEAEYRRINERSNISAKYKVNIVLGERKFEVPKEYWEKYTFENC